jgi:hypothetical protein
MQDIVSASDPTKTFEPISNLECGPQQEKEAPGVLFLPADDAIVVKLEICK